MSAVYDPGPATLAPRDEPGVKSARRAVQLIETFAARPGWLTFADLHELTGIPRSSLHGLVRTLVDAGWLDGDAASAGYRLGVRALTSGTAYLDHDPAVPYVTHALEQVRDTTGCTAHYARRFGRDVVYLETRESRNSTLLTSRVGRTLPAHATALGKVLLAELVDAELQTLLPARLAARTEHTLTSRDALLAQCRHIREQGFATEDEEGTLGVRCVAVALGYRIPATDAISASMPAGRVGHAEAEQVARALVTAGAELTRTLKNNGIR